MLQKQCRAILVQLLSICTEQLGGMSDRSVRADIHCPKISRRCSLYTETFHRCRKIFLVIVCQWAHISHQKI